jgi:hypothetical protein
LNARYGAEDAPQQTAQAALRQKLLPLGHLLLLFQLLLLLLLELALFVLGIPGGKGRGRGESISWAKSR